jgi:hypothetical protein
MLKSIGIVSGGFAIGLPIWGVALVGIGLVGAGAAIGYATCSLSGAAAGAVIAAI